MNPAPPSGEGRAEVECRGDRIIFGVQPRHILCSSVLVFYAGEIWLE